MSWIVRFDLKAAKELRKLDRTTQKRIIKYIDECLTTFPFDYGEELKGHLGGLRRYRIGDYRIICEIQEEIVTILVLKIGHRKNIYSKH